MIASDSPEDRAMLYPFVFHPIFKERIWGGRNLERLYQKQLPPEVAIGESWEVVDRTEDDSLIANGPLAGKSLHWLMENHRDDLLGPAIPAESNRFPLLIKILDAQQKLSLQVHPPKSKCEELGGEPKTELWFIADATPEAELYAGLKPGVTRAGFEEKLKTSHVAQCFHRIPVQAGDGLFLPSGRVHAIGAGNVIFEIQENSDTTYRVFDWNRVEANGKPRQLHVEKSLASIDFDDFEPRLIGRESFFRDGRKIRPLVRDHLFNVDLCEIEQGHRSSLERGMRIIGVVEGNLIVHGSEDLCLSPGQFCLVPASVDGVVVSGKEPVSFLEIFIG